MFFKRVLIGFFIFFITLMMFIFIIRLGNNKTGFLGLSDLLYYFDSGNVDFYKPISYFNSDIGGIIRDFTSFINGIQVNNPWDAFIVTINLLAKGFKMISIPVVLLFDFVKMVFSYIEIFVNFINWIISFEGYSATVY